VPDRNPLRRTVDRVEGLIVGGLAVAFLGGAPLTAPPCHAEAGQGGGRLIRLVRA
jgi:hypothetical protein